MESLEAALREQLFELTESGSPPEEHVGAIAQLNQRAPHSIQLEIPAAAQDPRLNCFEFALGLDPDDLKKCTDHVLFVGKEFMSEFIASLREINDRDGVPDGALVIYLDGDGAPVHAGIWRSGLVVSKWGRGNTNTWRHAIWEVPANYGSSVAFFERPASDYSLQTYREWEIAIRRALGHV
ncbi:hypothetical protein [Alsobacter sp. SYSU BS001988]